MKHLAGLLYCAVVFAHLSIQSQLVVAAPPITAVVFTPDGKRVLLGSQSGIQIRDWPQLELRKLLPTELEHVHDLSFSFDGTRLLAAGGSPAEAGVVEIFRWPDGTRLETLPAHEDLVTRIHCSAQSERWVTASADGLCKVFSAESDEASMLYRGHSRSVLVARFLPDGKSIVSAGVDQTIQLWDADSGTSQRTMNNHVGSVNDIAVLYTDANSATAVQHVRPVQMTIASASDDRTVRIWQPVIGRMVRFVKLLAIPQALAWSPKSNQLLVGCEDGTVQVLNAESLDVVKTIAVLEGPVYAIAIDPTGDRAIIAGFSEPIAIKW